MTDFTDNEYELDAEMYINAIIGSETESDSASESEYENAPVISKKRKTLSKSANSMETKTANDYLYVINGPVWLKMIEIKPQFTPLAENTIMTDPYKYLFTQSLDYLQVQNLAKHRELTNLEVATSTNVQFTAITTKDIYSFAGCLLIMDVYPMPSIDMYWGFNCVCS